MPELHLDTYCGGIFQTNGYLLRYGDRALVFDAPEGIADWLEAKGVRPDALILTHQHHDHVLDAALIAKRFECPVFAHSPHSDDLTLAKQLERMMGLPCPVEPYVVTDLLEGETTLDLAGLSFQILHVPGHSPDSLCFYHGRSGLLFGGDVLFQGSIGRTDFPNGDHDLLISGIREKLWPLPDSTIVLPGHGNPTGIAEEKATNPFLA